MKRIVILGSTGSIGTQVLDVCRRYPSEFEVVGITAGQRAEELLSQAKEFNVKYVGIKDESKVDYLKEKLNGNAKIFYGENFLEEIASIDEYDMLVVSVMGFSGLKAVLKGIEKGKKIALANKETLVAGGDLVMKKAREKGIDILPIDSEHSALWQCLHFNKQTPFHKLIITASGGPFYFLDKSEFKNITVERALKHPNWSMGSKITIDSATLMNKGLEVIEAMHLYSCPLDKIQAIVHPESIIHSMVEYVDGTVLSQMSYPSMDIPIQLAMFEGKREVSGVKYLDFATLQKCTFYPMDSEKFPCFKLALESAKMGGVYPCSLNAANEEAVSYFLQKKISFLDIPLFVERVLSKIENADNFDLQTLMNIDKLSRIYIREMVK